MIPTFRRACGVATLRNVLEQKESSQTKAGGLEKGSTGISPDLSMPSRMPSRTLFGSLTAYRTVEESRDALSRMTEELRITSHYGCVPVSQTRKSEDDPNSSVSLDRF